MTHICVGKLTIIGSDNGLSPGRRQAIIWTNAGILLIGPLGTKFSEILIKIYTFSFKKINLKVSSGKWRPSCLGLNELKDIIQNGRWHPVSSFDLSRVNKVPHLSKAISPCLWSSNLSSVSLDKVDKGNDKRDCYFVKKAHHFLYID